MVPGCVYGRLGAAGRIWAENFTWDRIARDQEQVYEAIVASREDCGFSPARSVR